MKIGRVHRGWVWIATVLFIFAAIVALNWNTFRFVLAIAFAEQRPALLDDARWDDKTSAQKFLDRFQPGINEKELIEWLTINQFEIDLETHSATRLIQSLPCNELVEIKWEIRQISLLESAQVLVSEAGCL